MATKYLQANQAMSTLVVYTAASGGSISTLDAGDDLVLNGYTLTLDAPALPASGTLSSITDFGKAGYVSVPLDTTGNCAIRATTITAGSVGAAGFIQVTGTTSNTLTVIGNCTAGAGTNTICINHNSTGVVSITGAVNGAGSGRHGAVLASTGTLNITGDVSAGTSGYGLSVTGAGTVNITGNVTASSGAAGYGLSISAAATVAISGSVTGGSGSAAHGIYMYTVGTMTVTVTGSINGGAGNGATGVYNTVGGNFTVVNGHVVNSTTAAAYCGVKPFVWTNDGSKYFQCAITEGTVKLGRQPAAGNLKSGIVCGDVTGTRTDCPAASAWNGTSYGDPDSPTVGTKRASSVVNCSAENVKTGITIDDVNGTVIPEGHTANQVIQSAGGNYVEPAASAVWYQTSFGVGLSGTKRASSIAGCSAANVKQGVTIDDVTGTVVEEHHTADQIIESAGGTAVEETHTADQILESAGGTAVEEHHSADEIVESAGGNYKEADPSKVWHGEPVGLTVGTMRASDIQNCVAANILAGVVVDDVEGSYEPPEAPDPDFVLTTATPPGNWIPAADEDVRAGTPNGLSSTGTLLVPTAATPMSMLEGCYNDEAVLWRRTGMDSHGKDQFEAPVAVYVRWQRVSELFVDKMGREKRSRAIVYVPTGVGVNEGDRFMIGSICDLETAAPPQTAWPVETIQDAKTLDGSVVQQKAYL